MIKMRKFFQNKLWRDKLVEIMEQKYGSIIHVKYLDDFEYNVQLKLKLIEEVSEVNSAQSKENLIMELADIFEVINALCNVNNITKEQIIEVQIEKYNKSGGFKERKFVTIAEHPEGSFGEKYCLADPKKYPEVL